MCSGDIRFLNLFIVSRIIDLNKFFWDFIWKVVISKSVYYLNYILIGGSLEVVKLFWFIRYSRLGIGIIIVYFNNIGIFMVIKYVEFIFDLNYRVFMVWNVFCNIGNVSLSIWNIFCSGNCLDKRYCFGIIVEFIIIIYGNNYIIRVVIGCFCINSIVN